MFSGPHYFIEHFQYVYVLINFLGHFRHEADLLHLPKYIVKTLCRIAFTWVNSQIMVIWSALLPLTFFFS